MVHFEVADVIRTVKYYNFSSYIMKLQYLKCILTRFFFSKINAEKIQFSYEIYQSGTQWVYGVSTRWHLINMPIRILKSDDALTFFLTQYYFVTLFLFFFQISFFILIQIKLYWEEKTSEIMIVVKVFCCLELIAAK